jgi:hypothetical protein
MPHLLHFVLATARSSLRPQHELRHPLDDPAVDELKRVAAGTRLTIVENLTLFA